MSVILNGGGIVARMTLKDRYGALLGTVDIDSSGKKTLRDRYGKLLGTYEPSGDITKDAYGKIVAYGDCLTMLLNGV